MMNQVITEYSNLVQEEFKTRRNWSGKVIHHELRKKLKFAIKTSGMCTTRNPSKRMGRTKFFGFLRYRKI